MAVRSIAIQTVEQRIAREGMGRGNGRLCWYVAVGSSHGVADPVGLLEQQNGSGPEPGPRTPRPDDGLAVHLRPVEIVEARPDPGAGSAEPDPRLGRAGGRLPV